MILKTVESVSNSNNKGYKSCNQTFARWNTSYGIGFDLLPFKELQFKVKFIFSGVQSPLSSAAEISCIFRLPTVQFEQFVPKIVAWFQSSVAELQRYFARSRPTCLLYACL